MSMCTRRQRYCTLHLFQLSGVCIHIRTCHEYLNNILSVVLLLNCLQNGRSAVHCGAREGHKEVVELLIDMYSLSATDKDNVS